MSFEPLASLTSSDVSTRVFSHFWVIFIALHVRANGRHIWDTPQAIDLAPISKFDSFCLFKDALMVSRVFAISITSI